MSLLAIKPTVRPKGMWKVGFWGRWNSWGVQSYYSSYPKLGKSPLCKDVTRCYSSLARIGHNHCISVISGWDSLINLSIPIIHRKP